MRLIDADELIKNIDYSADLGGALGKVVECVKYYAKFMVASAPTIERKTGECMNDPITNADRIRTMTDEELAEMFERWITNCDCNFTPCVEYCDMFDGKTCKERWLCWLKKAVDK